MKSYLVSQFGNPRGLVGQLVGRVMAYENKERNEWAVGLLDLQPTDQVLEIGFGPGLALHQIGKLVTAGFVAGVDRSPVMVAEAGKRNSAVRSRLGDQIKTAGFGNIEVQTRLIRERGVVAFRASS